jgi:hypothetical protein
MTREELKENLRHLETHLFVEMVYDRSPRRAEFEKFLHVVKLARACIESDIPATFA